MNDTRSTTMSKALGAPYGTEDVFATFANHSKPTLTADQAFEQCINLLESSANLHFAYSDTRRDRFKDKPDPERYMWLRSGEFLQDAANRIKKLQKESR